MSMMEASIYKTSPATSAPAPNSPPSPGRRVIAPEVADVAAAALRDRRYDQLLIVE
jgi:hypothetical protein